LNAGYRCVRGLPLAGRPITAVMFDISCTGRLLPKPLRF
jgi:hypothetical protein